MRRQEEGPGETREPLETPGSHQEPPRAQWDFSEPVGATAPLHPWTPMRDLGEPGCRWGRAPASP